MGSVAKGALCHDEVVMAAEDRVFDILRELSLREVVDDITSFENVREFISTEVEYEIVEQGWNIDLAVNFFDRVFVALEIKSKAEAQSASGWTRQLQKYTRVLRVPAVLVVSHELGEVQKAFLKRAGVEVINLLTLPRRFNT